LFFLHRLKAGGSAGIQRNMVKIVFFDGLMMPGLPILCGMQDIPYGRRVIVF
jgi:hypothetical protein